MIVNIYAGHNPDGKIGSGNVGIISESTEARKIKDYIMKMILVKGYRPIDCTCNNALKLEDINNTIIKNCKLNNVDFSVGIHFSNNRSNDGCSINISKYHKSVLRNMGDNILKRMEYLGFNNNGRIPMFNDPELDNIENLIIINCCNIDSKKDCSIYNPIDIATAISEGIGDTFGVKKVEVLYKVKVNVYKTAIKRTPGPDKPVSVDMRGNNIYKSFGTKLGIIEEKNNWGRLKSGEGWINLSQTIRV